MTRNAIGHPLSVLLALAAFILVTAAPQPGMATEKEVRFLSYRNCGAYTVKKLDLKWKDPESGETSKIRVANDIAGSIFGAGSRNRVCVDLKNYTIPEGAEVWFEFGIEAGDNNISCRKSNPRVKNSSSNYWQRTTSRGETKTNNRCQVGVYKDQSEFRWDRCTPISSQSC